MSVAVVTFWLLVSGPTAGAGEVVATTWIAAESAFDFGASDATDAGWPKAPREWSFDLDQGGWTDRSEMNDEESESSEESVLFDATGVQWTGLEDRESFEFRFPTSRLDSGTERRAVLLC